jgi:hypothetical protein
VVLQLSLIEIFNAVISSLIQDKTLTLYIRASNADRSEFGYQGVSFTLDSPDCPECNNTAFFKTD